MPRISKKVLEAQALDLIVSYVSEDIVDAMDDTDGWFSKLTPHQQQVFDGIFKEILQSFSRRARKLDPQNKRFELGG